MNPTPNANTAQFRGRPPVLTTPAEVQRRSAYQALQPSEKPSYWGVDQDPARRPGVPMMSRNPQPMKNARFPPERQQGQPAAPRHGRSNKPMPPVFGTSTPLHGLSGAIRRAAYERPDHYPSHWLLKMLGDRVDSWGYRLRKGLPILLPLAAAGLYGRRFLQRDSRPRVVFQQRRAFAP